MTDSALLTTPVWTTNTGIMMPMSEMSNSHIQSTIRALERIISTHPMRTAWEEDSDGVWRAHTYYVNRELYDQRILKLNQLREEIKKRDNDTMPLQLA